jgi:hypothetical protein
MERTGRGRDWLKLILALGGNRVTLFGAILTTSAGVTLVIMLLGDLLQVRPRTPYAGIVVYMILPAVFALGLLLMPAGALWRRWRLRRRSVALPAPPSLSLAEPAFKRVVVLVGAASMLNILIMGVASYRGVEYMDSVRFCGLTCHSVMAPEYAAYLDSPHARVACVECHIGPGAPWFVRSKLSGTRQIFAVNLGTYSRPIPSPVKHLRPARETCEHCHWPARFSGDKVVVRTHYQEDEANTALRTVLILKVGGRTLAGAAGIHGRHLDTMERIEYVTTDEKRSVIPRVYYRDDDGSTVEFVAESEGEKGTPAYEERRKMDCMDCHNRPSHAFEMPGPALDHALDRGRISTKLPFIKKKALELLQVEYADHDAARRQIREGLLAFYRSEYPGVFANRRALIEAAAEQIGVILGKNVFPGMKVTWGTYPNHLGHDPDPGCFRCHDEEHTAADGRTITQDCETCHKILAMEEPNPQILAELGMN